ncbi:hypothetical protein IWX90DRAFT_428334 [Phyllosticta citrichinensis]|uniref:2EXR domain-containing protein n=1 Tax=Phyllosticta citrichinensis TaxID=1130410 RepID=A0ABR1Y090_9PEZI
MAGPAASSDQPSPAQPTIRLTRTLRTPSPEKHRRPHGLLQENLESQLDGHTTPEDKPDSGTKRMTRCEKRMSTTSQSGDAGTSASQADASSGQCADPSRSQRMHQRNYFPFMELPSELRLEIYRMALCRPKPVLLHLPRSVTQDDPASEKEDSSDCALETGWNRGATSQRRLVQRQWDEYRVNPKHTFDKGLNCEPLIPAILRVSKLIHREAKPVLYSENELTLWLPTGLCTLMHLHQRSRSLIKHIRLRLPTYHDILDGFSELVRLGLRYCWGLKTLTISLPEFPYDRNAYGPNTPNVYVNAFHILRWLPKHTVVRLDAHSHEDIRRVVEENCRLANLLSEVSYQRKMMYPDSIQEREVT